MGWRASQVGEAVAELLGEGTAPVLGTIETLFAEAPQVRRAFGCWPGHGFVRARFLFSIRLSSTCDCAVSLKSRARGTREPHLKSDTGAEMLCFLCL